MDIAGGRVVLPVDWGVRETALCGGIAPRGNGLPVGVGLDVSRGDSTGGVAGLGGSTGAPVKEPKALNSASPVRRGSLEVVSCGAWVERGVNGAREVSLKG